MTAGFAAHLVEAAIARLLAAGYLDDLAFARAWVASRDRAHPRGAVALRRELRLRGVDEAVIDAVLAEREAEAVAAADDRLRPTAGPAAPAGGQTASTGSSSADAEAAARLLARRATALARIADPQRRRARAYALLARAGFEPEIAADLARSVAAEVGSDPAEG